MCVFWCRCVCVSTDLRIPTTVRQPAAAKEHQLHFLTYYTHRSYQERNGGAAAARNTGVAAARGEVVVFIDSDLVVAAPNFLSAHTAALRRAFEADGDRRAFTYGRVVNSTNFDEPTTERFKLTDLSAAFFATGNVAIARARLLEVEEAGAAADGGGGPFDADLFDAYGWEDLELGERLRATGTRIVQCPEAVVRRCRREGALRAAAEGSPTDD